MRHKNRMCLLVINLASVRFLNLIKNSKIQHKDISSRFAGLSLQTDIAPPRIPSKLLKKPRPQYVSRESRISHTIQRQQRADSRKSKRDSLVAAKDLERRLETRTPEIFNKKESLLQDIYFLDGINDIDFFHINGTDELYLVVFDRHNRAHTYSGPAVEAARPAIIKYAVEELGIDDSKYNEDKSD